MTPLPNSYICLIEKVKGVSVLYRYCFYIINIVFYTQIKF